MSGVTMKLRLAGHTIGRIVAGLACAACLARPALAGEPVLATDCAGEIKAHCSKVTPGADRLVACLIAYEDKISPRCRLSVYLSSGNLDERLKGLRAMAKICSADILQYCAQVEPGGGRIYDCLKKHQATLTDECRKNVPQFEKMLAD